MATKLTIAHQPFTGSSGDDFIIPVVATLNINGTVDANYTGSYITASWVPVSGSGSLGGTLAIYPLNGSASFYDIYVNTTSQGCTGYFSFTAPGQTGVTSSTIAISGPNTPASKIAYGTRIQTDGYTGESVYIRSPSQQNFIAATGQTLDYRILIEALTSGSKRDTTYTGSVTATVASGSTCTLGGTVVRNFVRGRADFSDLYPASGTGSLAITFSSPGLTSFTTAVMQVVTPQFDTFQYSSGSFVKVELPRLTVDTVYPSSFSAEYTVNRSIPSSSTNFGTLNEVINQIVNDNPATDVRVKISPGTYNGTVTLKSKAATTGLICFEPAGGIPGVPGQRITPAEVQAAGVKITTDVGNLWTIFGDGEGHHYRFSGIEITMNWTSSTFFAFSLVSLLNKQAAVDPANPPSISQVPHHIGFDRCWLHGEPNRGLRKGVIDEGSYNFITNCYIDEVHALRSPDQGSGDENAICSVASVGPCLYENNMLRATGEVMIFGGSNPNIFDRRSRDITIRRNVLLAPREWQTLYKHKNNFEVKSTQRMLIECNVHDGAWNGNQDGAGIKFGSGNQYGGVIDNYEGASDCTFRYNFCRNMQSFFSFSRQISPDSTLLNHLAFHHNTAVNIDDPTTWIDGTGNRAGASETTRIGLWVGGGSIFVAHNTMLTTANTSSVNVRAFYPDADYPATSSFYRDNIAVCQGYGLIAGNGGVGSTCVSQSLPQAGNFTNVFIAGPNNGSNYAAGAVHGVGMSSQGVQFPAEAYYPTTISDVGFVDTSVTASWDTADPDVVLAALQLSSGSVHKGVATDATDPGADIPTLRTKIAGVWNGGAVAAGAPHHFVVDTVPGSAVSKVPISASFSVSLRDASGSVVTGVNSTITAIVASGYAVITSGKTTSTSAGTASFSGLQLAGYGPVQLRFTSGSLTSSLSSVINVRPVFVTSSLLTAIGQFIDYVVDHIIVVPPSLSLSPATPSASVVGTAYNAENQALNQQVYFRSSNTQVATVDKLTGLVTAVNSGSVTIVGMSTDPMATHLSYSVQPGNSSTGSFLLNPQPSIVALDLMNTVDTGITGSVNYSLQIISGSPVLSGSTSQTFVNGVATTTNLMVSGSGLWVLSASVSGLPIIVSSARGNVNPNKPTLTVRNITSASAVLSGSAFSDSDVGDFQTAAQWQVTTASDINFGSPIISTGDDAVHLTSYTASAMSSSTNYLARARYKDNNGNYSAWATASFATSGSGTTFTNAIRFSGTTQQATVAPTSSYNDLSAFTVAVLVRWDGVGGGTMMMSKNNLTDTTGWKCGLVGTSSADITVRNSTTDGFKRDLFITNDNAWRWVFVGIDRSAHTQTRSVGPQGGTISDIGSHTVSDGGVGTFVSDANDPLKLGVIDPANGGCATNMEIRFVGIASSVLSLAQMQSIANDAVGQSALFIDYWKPNTTGGSGTSIPSGKGVLPALVTNGATVI